MKEKELHRAVAEFLGWTLLPPAVWTTFPAGWGKGKATFGQLKGCGLMAGMPDILVFHEATAIGIELKTDKGKLSKSQDYTFSLLEKAGVPVFVCRNVDEVYEALRMEALPCRNIQLKPKSVPPGETSARLEQRGGGNAAT